MAIGSFEIESPASPSAANMLMEPYLAESVGNDLAARGLPYWPGATSALDVGPEQLGKTSKAAVHFVSNSQRRSSKGRKSKCK
jgi:hypothetical protein